MNHKSYPPHHEDYGNNSDDAYRKWQDAMRDVDFQGGGSSFQKKPDKTKTFLGKIQGLRGLIKRKFSISSSEQSVEKTDDTPAQEKWNLTKVSRQLGSNEGGWYENPDGERYYVKFYKNPNQGRAEFVANAIYEKAGIKAVRSEMIQLDGREAIASPVIPGATAASKEAQKASEDVQKGFVADAFLANWDVVGLAFDNIVQSDDGFYRIDNGGSLIFRAQGGDKTYSPDSIPELNSMLANGRPAGEIFAGITEKEIRRQAQDLVSKVKPEDIRTIVDESGLTGEDRDRILAGLLGRREYLAKTYGKSISTAGESVSSEKEINLGAEARRPRRSMSEAIRLVSNQEMEQSRERLVRPKTEIVCDHGHIEGQRIDVIDKRDKGVVEFKFKLREPTEKIRKMITEFNSSADQPEVVTSSGVIMKKGQITYESTSGPLDDYSAQVLCDAFIFEKNGVEVAIADYRNRHGVTKDSIVHQNSGAVRSAMGLVKIDISADMDPEKMENTLAEILGKDLGIPDALGEVPKEAEREYKVSRYKWQHAIRGELSPEQKKQAERLEREEVFPGYTTFIEKGKHEEYLSRYGKDIRAFHSLYSGDTESIHRVLTQGLMSTTERYSRGFLKKGLSSTTDIDMGGADSVFTRVGNKMARMRTDDGSLVILKPEIFDRTDWYSYSMDRYGSTEDNVFDVRLSPDALFDYVTDPISGSCSAGNEQMFRTGIGANYIESIEVSNDSRDKIIAELRSMGLKEVDGRPIEEVITSRKTLSEESDVQKAIDDLFADLFAESPESDEASSAPISPNKSNHATYEQLGIIPKFNVGDAVFSDFGFSGIGTIVGIDPKPSAEGKAMYHVLTDEGEEKTIIESLLRKHWP
ncbi:MAG: hypothetical protein Q4F60_01370 [Candidatus Saccharibacteria bacterium]|nr:hypothetical protein [Candidatus Saccharibacteria bacterium]